jgi:WD40 repeat protein
MLVARLSNLKTPVYSTALFLLILLAVGCSAGAYSPDEELEGLALSENGFCLGELFCQDLEFQKEEKLLFMESGDEGRYVVIAPGMMKFTLDQETSIISFTLSGGRLSLKVDGKVFNYSYAEAIVVETVEPLQETKLPAREAPDEDGEIAMPERGPVKFTWAYTLDVSDTLEKNACSRLMFNSETGHADMVKDDPFLSNLEVSPDGRLLFATAGDAGMMTWDLVSQSVIADIGGRCLKANTSPDGRNVIVDSSYCYLGVFKSTSLELVSHIEGEICTTLNDVHPYENVVLASVAENKVVVHDLLSGSEIDSIQDCRFAVYSRSGSSIICFSGNQSIDVLDSQTLERLSRHQLGGSVDFYSLSVSPTEDVIAYSEGGKSGVILYNLITEEKTEFRPDASDEKFYRTAFSEDGRLVAISGSENTYIWEVKSASLVFEIRQDNSTVADIAFIPGTRQLAIAYATWIEVWNEE